MSLINDYHVAIINGAEAKSLSAFLNEIGRAFVFPDYYGSNMNALWDCITDLEWLSKKNYALIIKNNEELLTDEPENIKDDVLQLLDEVSHNWASVPNYEGEQVYRNKSIFLIYLD